MMPAGQPIRVLVVEGSAAQRDLLVHLLDGDNRFQTVATASDGNEAADLAARLRPDVVVMNLRLARLDGIGATRRIMAETPTPIVIVSTSSDGMPTERAAEALQAGAVTVLDKPLSLEHPQYAHAVKELLTSIRLMAEVKVVRRPAIGGRRHLVLLPPHEPTEKRRPVALVMAASTGGPQAIQTVLQALGPDLDVPVLVVQHMSKGFLAGMVGWLAGTCPQPVQLAVHGVQPTAGTVYVAPEEHHLLVTRAGKLIHLTPREYALLEFLAFHLGKVVSRTMIWEHLYNEEDENTSNVVDVFIRYLRNKIDKGFDKPLILTRWGEGYLLRGGDQ